MSSLGAARSPLLCDPRDKRRLEIENRADVIRFISGFFDPAYEGRKPYQLGVIKELHALTIRGIYPCEGELRDAVSEVKIVGAGFEPRPPFQVKNDLNALLDEARSWDAEWDVYERARFAADRFHEFLNIHPFRGGNGRVARAFLHLMLYDMGVLQPPEQVFDYIYYRRGAYLEALRAADTGRPAQIRSFVVRGVTDARSRELFALLTEGLLSEYVMKRMNRELKRYIRDIGFRGHLSDDGYRRLSHELDRRLSQILIDPDRYPDGQEGID